jgi:hypothetical protein
MIEIGLYALFQVINGISSLSMMAFPKRFHESLMKDPERVYQSLGFSPTAIGMLHNVIRGQGAALLSISLFMAFTGPHSKQTFLLMALAATLTLISHIMTAVHHARDAKVMAAIGSLKSLYPLLALNAIFAIGGFWIYFQ